LCRLKINPLVSNSLTQCGKGKMGWLYRIKLHFIVGNHGAIVVAKMTINDLPDTQPVRELSYG